MYIQYIDGSDVKVKVDFKGEIPALKRLISWSRLKNFQTPLKKNFPGRRSFEGFLKRHLERSRKKAEYLSKTRAAVREDTTRKWFILNTSDKLFWMR